MELKFRVAARIARPVEEVFEAVANELELWSNSASSQLEAQMRERRHSFARRIEAVDRIQQAASGLMEHIAAVEAAEAQLQHLEQQLDARCHQLLHLPLDMA